MEWDVQGDILKEIPSWEASHEAYEGWPGEQQALLDKIKSEGN
jgi:hypothetical protein